MKDRMKQSHCSLLDPDKHTFSPVLSTYLTYIHTSVPLAGCSLHFESCLPLSPRSPLLPQTAGAHCCPQALGWDCCLQEADFPPLVPLGLPGTIGHFILAALSPLFHTQTLPFSLRVLLSLYSLTSLKASRRSPTASFLLSSLIFRLLFGTDTATIWGGRSENNLRSTPTSGKN